ncbi:MAG: hypothetical protein ACHP9Y_05800, partial [Gammaproteobacteria bacterium]
SEKKEIYLGHPAVVDKFGSKFYKFEKTFDKPGRYTIDVMIDFVEGGKYVENTATKHQIIVLK